MRNRRPSNHTAESKPPPTPSEAAFERLLGSLEQPEATTLSTFVDAAFAAKDSFLERDPYASIGAVDGFYTKVVGVSFEGRQDVLAGLQPEFGLELKRQAENAHDSNAVAVYYGNLQLGYLRAGIAKHLAPAMDAGVLYRAKIASLTGGPAPGSATQKIHRGVNLYVWRTAGSSATASGDRMARESWDGDAQRVRRALIGDYRPHEAQLALLERVEAGRHALGIMGTGRGKSFCFHYPAALRALNAGEKTLVLYPLRALANDQYEALMRMLDPLGIRIHRANGSISAPQREELFSALRTGEWDIILATPEFLEFHRSAFTGPSVPSLVVVDEAHHLYESRHRAAYGRLGETIASLGSPQVLAVTATAGDEAFAHIVRELRIDAWVIDPTIRENLHVHDARGTKNKIGYLRELTAEDDGRTIVYCNSRNEATKVAEALRATLGDKVMFYHAGMPAKERHEVEQYFRSGQLRVVVATSAFGEGIDLPDVRDVVLYHLNFDFPEFNQQAGRAGRDGQPARIHLLYGQRDRNLNEFIIDRSSPTLPTLRDLYRGMRDMAREDLLRASAVDVARTLELDRADERTVAAALRIFEEAGLVEAGLDDDGRYVRFRRVTGKVDLAQTERFAEGEAERESLAKYCELALGAGAEVLERIVNRPIYPQRVALLR
ncbi:MAG: helicase-related protein [Vulcanimicrobiaceae bacterium]